MELTLSNKSFTTYAPTTKLVFDINGTEFRLNNAIPGDVLLDFMAGSASENTADMAKIVRSLFKEAVHEDDYEQFNQFIRDKNNHVDLETLTDIAAYLAEQLAGSGKAQEPSPDSWPSAG